MQLLKAVFTVIGVAVIGRATSGLDSTGQEFLVHPEPSEQLTKEEILDKLDSLTFYRDENVTEIAVELFYMAKDKGSTELIEGLTVASLIEQNHIQISGCSKTALKKRHDIAKMGANFQSGPGIRFPIYTYLLFTLNQAAIFCADHKNTVIDAGLNDEYWLDGLANSIRAKRSPDGQLAKFWARESAHFGLHSNIAHAAEMSTQNFGVIIPGRPVDTNFQQVDTNKFLITIQEAKTINHLVIFLTSVLPPDTVGCIFFSLPDPNASPTWHYLGYLTNQKPSAIYKLNNLTQSKIITSNGGDERPTNAIGFNYIQNYTLLVGQIGISIEPFSSEIGHMVPAVETAASNANLFTEFINKTVGNLYNYCLSFSKSAEELAIAVNPFQQRQTANSDQYVPLKCIQTWYENYTRRLSNDQNFWKTLAG